MSNELDALKAALENYLATAEDLVDPRERALAVEKGWQTINGVTKHYYRGRVASVRALAALPCEHDPSRSITQKEMAALLGVSVSIVNTLVRGGWDVKPQYQRNSVGATRKK